MLVKFLLKDFLILINAFLTWITIIQFGINHMIQNCAYCMQHVGVTWALVFGDKTAAWLRLFVLLKLLCFFFILGFWTFWNFDRVAFFHDLFIFISWSIVVFFFFDHLIMRWLPKGIFGIGLRLLNILVFEKVNDIFNLVFNLASAVRVFI